MSYISQKERIFRVRRTRNNALIRRLKGNIRFVESCKDLRLVSMDCFERHQALLDALTGREADLMGEDSEIEDNQKLQDEIDRLKKECERWSKQEENWEELHRNADQEKRVSRMSIASLQSELLKLRQLLKDKDRQVVEAQAMASKLAQDNEKALQLMSQYEKQGSTYPDIEKQVKGLKKEVSGLARTSISEGDSKEKINRLKEDYEGQLEHLRRQLAEANNMLSAYEDQLRDLPIIEAEIEKLKQPLLMYEKQMSGSELDELRALVKLYEQQLAELPAIEHELEELRRLVLKLQNDNQSEISSLERDVNKRLSKLTGTSGDEIANLKKKLAEMQTKCEEQIKTLTIKHEQELQEKFPQKSKGERDTEKAEVTQVQEQFAALQQRCDQEKSALEAQLKKLREQYEVQSRQSIAESEAELMKKLQKERQKNERLSKELDEQKKGSKELLLKKTTSEGSGVRKIRISGTSVSSSIQTDDYSIETKKKMMDRGTGEFRGSKDAGTSPIEGWDKLTPAEQKKLKDQQQGTDPIKDQGKEIDELKKQLKGSTNSKDLNDMAEKYRKLQQLVDKFKEAKDKYEKLLSAEKKKNAKLEEAMKEGSCMPECLCKKLGLDAAARGDGPLDLLTVLMKVFHSGVKSLTLNEIAQLHEETKSALARKIEKESVTIELLPQVKVAYTEGLSDKAKEALLDKLGSVEQQLKIGQEEVCKEVQHLERGVLATKRRLDNMKKKSEVSLTPAKKPIQDTSCHCP